MGGGELLHLESASTSLQPGTDGAALSCCLISLLPCADPELYPKRKVWDEEGSIYPTSSLQCLYEAQKMQVTLGVPSGSHISCFVEKNRRKGQINGWAAGVLFFFWGGKVAHTGDGLGLHQAADPAGQYLGQR